MQEPSGVQRLLVQAKQKATSASGGKFRELRNQLGIALALLQAWVVGDYRGVSKSTVVILVTALLYFVVPMDVIPDFLLGWGFLDDAAILGYVFSQLSDEIKAFREWQDDPERNQGERSQGERNHEGENHEEG